MDALLNPPQREAVDHTRGPILVLAGAGSGKTRVITYRIARLLRAGIPARAIGALTFTNKAANEMRERIAKLLGDRKTAGELTMGTFHSLGLAILKKERKALGFPRGFVIYDTSDQLGAIRELLRRVDVGGRRFDVKAILSRISLAKNAFIAPEDYDPNEWDEYDEITAEIYPRYQAALRAYAAVDFDDLITEVVRLFDREPEIRKRWADKFQYLMVDEYQDTNTAQVKMVRHLVSTHGNLCVVGDDDQSIYSWRGAEPRNILEFDRMFPGARVVKLEQNYRSTPNILAAANAVIANNSDRHGKELWSDRASGPAIVSAVAPDMVSEAKFVVHEILKLRDNEHRRWSDFAILYRSNLQTRALEEELRTLQVPYRLFGGQQFFERKEVKDVIAYLRLALNPRDDIALRRVINYPGRGIGTTSVRRLAEYALGHRCSMWKAVENAAELELRPKSMRAVEGFRDIIGRLRTGLESGGVVSETRALMDEIDLYGDLRAASPSLTAAQRRIDNVEMLLKSLARHEETSPGPDALLTYLRMLSLNASEDDEEQAGPGNKVCLTTLHGAKGLEFPVVFLIGLEEELLPHHRTLTPTASDLSDPDHAADVSEERRLAYVGITRAQQMLYLTRAAFRTQRGKPQPRTPSRFLLEIPPDLLEERDVEEEAKEPVVEDEVRSFFANFDFGE